MMRQPILERLIWVYTDYLCKVLAYIQLACFYSHVLLFKLSSRKFLFLSLSFCFTLEQLYNIMLPFHALNPFVYFISILHHSGIFSDENLRDCTYFRFKQLFAAHSNLHVQAALKSTTIYVQNRNEKDQMCLYQSRHFLCLKFASCS